MRCSFKFQVNKESYKYWTPKIYVRHLFTCIFQKKIFVPILRYRNYFVYLWLRMTEQRIKSRSIWHQNLCPSLTSLCPAWNLEESWEVTPSPQEPCWTVPIHDIQVISTWKALGKAVNSMHLTSKYSSLLLLDRFINLPFWGLHFS